MARKTTIRCAVFWAVLTVSLRVFADGAAPVAKHPSTALSGTVDISADRLSVDHGEKRAVFEGRVRATFGKLRVTCAKLVLRYDDAGEVAGLAAWGKVTVVTADARASAGSARLDAAQSELVLEDHPSIVRGPHRLTGDRISVRLDTGEVEVLGARGVFQLQKAAPK